MEHPPVAWEAIAGYTAANAPMILHRETVYSFMVIGDTAYCLTPLTSRDTETSNSVLVDERELTINDIIWYRKDRGIILVILLQKQQKRLYD